jgi:hypothetical protein
VDNPEFVPVLTKEMLEKAKEILMSGPRAKMATCPFCHKRRRLGEKCCSAEYRKGSETAYITKTYVKRFQKKHHGQSREYQIRRLTLEFFADFRRMEAALVEMGITKSDALGKPQPIVPALANIPPFAEKYYLWKMARENRAEEKMKSASRRRNRGR